MCVTELNVSILPCRHRWYHLQKPCGDSTDLSNCGMKLGITGWEIKCDFCPYCAGWNIPSSEYRLVGNDRTPSVGGFAPTPPSTLSMARRESRSRHSSLSRSDSNTSLTMITQEKEKNRAMNARVDAYFNRVPARPEVAPLSEIDELENGLPSPSEASSDGRDSLRRSSTSSQPDKAGLFKKMRSKSKRMSFNMFK